MASNANWTVVFDDKIIIKQNGDSAGPHTINDDAFWSQSKFSNIWAIQHGTSVSSDEVEYRDDTPHSSYDSSVLGDFQEFINRWDSAQLAKLQSDWDDDPRDESEKGSRPTSYSS
ncbi:hypothetical protein [Hyphomonas sp.]|jgi:hypothetical protein|uniref:hypothetical protein n=1 Tax=Hyphomonas sp. TaxID=87 RepID=UPI0025BD57AC|nr:hypothetical protein [Hyphomonas sp.]|tara:strand:- start:183 stop:527 length:345 start_codon:yes stop_codon:yes gene_type:complete